MWELAFNIPIPNLTGLISGFCLGWIWGIVFLFLLYWLIMKFSKEEGQEDIAISFKDIEGLTTDD